MLSGSVSAQLAVERRQLALWIPVLFGAGIWTYFSLELEPSNAIRWLCLLVAICGTICLSVPRFAFVFRAMMCAVALFAAGFSAAQFRALGVAAPVLEKRVSATVEGRVIGTSRSHTGLPRLLLDRVVIHGFAPEETPHRVRVTLRKTDTLRAILPGAHVTVYARLSPPSGPVEPGGFDFRRYAWFQQLGAIGLAGGAVILGPVAGTDGLIDRARVALARLRANLSVEIRDLIPGETGSFAAAILVGDRSGIARETTEALRASNLSHLLAISGLHMGLLTGFVFGLVRYGLALVSGAALRLNTKKCAAVAAIACGTGYLLISGASIATQRSYLMVLVILAAVLLSRPALTLRAVALAAMLILVLRPESLMQIGFQMSFAATIALVAVFSWVNTNGYLGSRKGFLGQACAVLVTSLVAGFATAPFAAASFHQTAPYGLLANVLAVPLMGTVIMPSAVVALLLTPFGLSALPFEVMGAGIEIVLAIARFVADLDGSVRPIPLPNAPVLVPLTLGGLWLCLWSGRIRLIGTAGIVGGLVWWTLATARPDILVSSTGKQVGLMTVEGRVLLDPRKDSYVVRRWLAADGDAVTPFQAAARDGFLRARDLSTGRMGQWTVATVTTKKISSARLASLCQEKTVLIAPRIRKAPAGECVFVGREDLYEKGAMAFTLKNDDLSVEMVNGPARRLWTRTRSQ